MEKLVRYDMSEFQTQESLGLLLRDRVREKGIFSARPTNARKRERCCLTRWKRRIRASWMSSCNAWIAARVTLQRRDARLERILYRDDFQHRLAELMTLATFGRIHAGTPCPFPRPTIIAPEIFARITEKLVVTV